MEYFLGVKLNIKIAFKAFYAFVSFSLCRLLFCQSHPPELPHCLQLLLNQWILLHLHTLTHAMHTVLNAFLSFDQLLKALLFRTQLASYSLLNAYLSFPTIVRYLNCYLAAIYLLCNFCYSLSYNIGHIYLFLYPLIVSSLWAGAMLYLSLCFYCLHSNWYVVDTSYF